MAVELKAKSTLDTGPFDSGIARMKNMVRGFVADATARMGGGAWMGGRGGLIGGAAAMVGGFAISAYRSVDALKDQAEAADTSMSRILELSITARKHGQDIGVVIAAYGRLRDAQGAVINGNAATAKAFERLGISEKEVASLNTDQLFKRVAAAFTTADGAAKEYNATADLLGVRTLPQLAGILNEVAGSTELVNKSMDGLTEISLQAAEDAKAAWQGFWMDFQRNFVIGAEGLRRFFSEGIGGINAMGIEAEMKNQERAAAKRRATEANMEAQKERQEKEAAALAAKREAGLAAIAERVKPGAIIADSLAKVGGMIGGAADPSLRYAQRSIEIAEKQKEFLAKIEKNTKDQPVAEVAP